ncbi:MAG: biopolymer transporter ExbB [Candidatus Hydrogenedentota bacterium]
MTLPAKFGACILLVLLVMTGVVIAQDTPTDTADASAQSASGEAETAAEVAADSRPDELKQLTLWDMLREGGLILAIIVGLSVVAAIMAIYCFLTVTPRREVPAQFIKRAHNQIRAGDLRGAYQMCEDRDELIANVLRAGLKMHGHDRYVIQEAMESEGERGSAALWQKISYLNNIGTIAPLLGLLGTVWGMIGAFSAMALNDSEARSLVMAYNVAQAMITTAAGLMLAIPCMVMYYYLRGRVVKIVAEVEAQATEFIELLAGGAGR